MFDYKKWKSDGGPSIHESVREKQPIRRLESSLNRCINIVIPLHVEMLHKHKTNIEKFRQLREWHNVNREQVNAIRTVEQLKSDVWSLDLLKNQLIENDMPEFEKRTRAIPTLVTEAIQTFFDGNDAVFISDTRSVVDYSCQQYESDEQSDALGNDLGNQVLLLHISEEQRMQDRLEQSRLVEASWKRLANDLEDIKEMMSMFGSCVHHQQEAIDSIESHIEKANDNVTRGKTFLAQAVRYKAAVYPLSGAVLGSCLLGPLGLIVGLKAGVAALAIGGLLGFQSGQIIKKSKMKALEAEFHNVPLSNLNDKTIKRSESFPNLSSPTSKCYAM